MSMIQRQVLHGVVFSLIMFAALAGSYSIVHPFGHWSEFWERKLMDIPFIVCITMISLGLGLLFGLISGIYWRKQFQAVEHWLFLTEEGKFFGREIPSESSPELGRILDSIHRIQKKMAETAALSQRLANEKVVEQESRIQEIISEERNRLARELHDSVSQQLFAASMMMSAINESREKDAETVPAKESQQLKMVEEIIHTSQLEMRALLLHLRPVALKGKTLQEGIEELLSELSQKVILDISWKLERFKIDKGIEDHLFRILQESVSNTLRHSKAGQLEVLLICRDDTVILRVSDNGVGFDIDVESSNAGSYGLQNMKERAGELGGILKIVSIPNKGTKLEVKVPILYKGGGRID